MHLRDQLGAVFCDLASDMNQEAYLTQKRFLTPFSTAKVMFFEDGVMAALAAAMLGGRRI